MSMFLVLYYWHIDKIHQKPQKQRYNAILCDFSGDSPFILTKCCLEPETCRPEHVHCRPEPVAYCRSEPSYVVTNIPKRTICAAESQLFGWWISCFMVKTQQGLAVKSYGDENSVKCLIRKTVKAI